MMALFVHVKRAQNLRSADFMGKSDPYVKFEEVATADRHSCWTVSTADNKPLTTRVIDNNNNPQWDECFLLKTGTYSDGRPDRVCGIMSLNVFDSDAGVIVDGSDDFLGTCTVDWTGVPADGR